MAQGLMCQKCAAVWGKPDVVIYFRGCYTAGVGKCAECLRHSGRACTWPEGQDGPLVGECWVLLSS